MDLQRIVIAMQEGDYRTAAALCAADLRTADGLDGRNLARLHFLGGEALLRLEDWSAAIERFRAALDLRPYCEDKVYRITYNLALALARRNAPGDADEALALWQDVAAHCTERDLVDSARFNAAWALADRGELERAQEAAQDLADCPRELALSFIHLQRGDVGAAAKHAAEALHIRDRRQPWHVARAAWLCGEAALARGDQDYARTFAVLAWDRAMSSGDVYTLNRAAALKAKCGEVQS